MSTIFPAPRDPARDPEHPLARAFASFTEAAGSLERTYGQLQGQVAHLRQELEVTNRDLATSLEENHRIRERLRRILEGLPCGVLVVEAGARISALNPEAARLLGAAQTARHDSEMPITEPEAALIDELLTPAYAAVTPQEWDAWLAAGRALSQPEALALLRSLGPA